MFYLFLCISLLTHSHYQSFPRLPILPYNSLSSPSSFFCPPSLFSEYSHCCSHLSSFLCSPSFLSSVNCSVNPLRVGLQFTLPQLHMSILPPLLLLFFFFFYSGWDGAASSPGRQAGGELHEPGWEWSLPACLGHSCEEQNCLPLSVLLSLHIWCVGGTGPCCAVLFCPWRDTAAGFWPGHFVVGLDLRCKSAHCYAHTDEPGSFGYSKQWLLSQWINY